MRAAKRPETGMSFAGEEPLPLEGLLHLFVVYVVWGSTYLAIRVSVQQGSGFPPFTMAATRLMIAGILLLLWAKLRGRRIQFSRQELAVLVASGVLLWGVANGLVAWAEQRADSSLAALIIGTVPIWASVLDSLADGHLPGWRLMASLLIGLAGVALLAVPVFRDGVRADVLGVAAMLVAALSWALGSVLQRRRPVELGLLASSGYQHVFGSFWLLGLVWLMGEPRAQPSTAAWLGWGYLILFGGLAFTSYVRALRLLPISVSTTYAYVNPVIAVFLGWAVLSEPITLWTITGAALVLAGVAGVFRERYAWRRRRMQTQSLVPDDHTVSSAEETQVHGD